MSPGLGEAEASHTGLIWMNNFITYSLCSSPLSGPVFNLNPARVCPCSHLDKSLKSPGLEGWGHTTLLWCPVLLWVGVSVCSSSCSGSSEALWVSYLLWRSGQSSCLALPSYTGSDLVSCWMEWPPRKTPAGGVMVPPEVAQFPHSGLNWSLQGQKGQNWQRWQLAKVRAGWKANVCLLSLQGHEESSCPRNKAPLVWLKKSTKLCFFKTGKWLFENITPLGFQQVRKHP